MLLVNIVKSQSSCRLFSVTGTGRSEVVFTHIGFRDWKHVLGKNGSLQKHDKCHTHIETIGLNEMKNSKNSVAQWFPTFFQSGNPYTCCSNLRNLTLTMFFHHIHFHQINHYSKLLIKARTSKFGRKVKYKGDLS